jgi:hypothetical protein
MDKSHSDMSTFQEEIHPPTIRLIGVFGASNHVTQEDIHEYMTHMLSELGGMPTKILLPSEGNSSIYLQEWAESLHVSTMVFQPDWMRNGRMAQILRDDRMWKECSHAMVFLSPKSNRLEKVAERMAKKGKMVVTISSDGKEITQLTCEPVVPALPVSKKASACAHKSNTGTTQTLLKFQTTK